MIGEGGSPQGPQGPEKSNITPLAPRAENNPVTTGTLALKPDFVNPDLTDTKPLVSIDKTPVAAGGIPPLTNAETQNILQFPGAQKVTSENLNTGVPESKPANENTINEFKTKKEAAAQVEFEGALKAAWKRIDGIPGARVIIEEGADYRAINVDVPEEFKNQYLARKQGISDSESIAKANAEAEKENWHLMEAGVEPAYKKGMALVKDIPGGICWIHELSINGKRVPAVSYWVPPEGVNELNKRLAERGESPGVLLPVKSSNTEKAKDDEVSLPGNVTPLRSPDASMPLSQPVEAGPSRQTPDIKQSPPRTMAPAASQAETPPINKP